MNEAPIAPESMYTWMMRWRFNFFPAFRNTGGRITHISGDGRAIQLQLPLKRGTRNYVGTTYGGSMYSAVDPIYMIIFINVLGKQYIVWDQSGSIKHIKPGRTTLYADIRVTEDEINSIKSELDTTESLTREFSVELCDAEGVLHAKITKKIYFRRKAKFAKYTESSG